MTQVLNVGQWEGLRRDLILIRRARVDPQYLDINYRPEGASVAWRLIKGRVTLRINRRTVVAGAGRWVFPGSQEGRRSFSDDAEIISMRFRVIWPTGEALFNHDAPAIPTLAAGQRLDRAAFNLVDFVQEKVVGEGRFLARAEVDLRRYLKIRRRFEHWFEHYVECMTGLGIEPTLCARVDDRILEAIRRMDADLKAGRIQTEARVASAVGLSLSQFKRLFTRDLRKTPRQWLDLQRLDLARGRLDRTRDPIKRIAFELGFRSPNHFSAWYRRLCGQSPRAARPRSDDRL